jgi:hypothetical protein
MSSRAKEADAKGLQTYQLHMSNVLKSGSIKFPEATGPVQVCTGIALPLPLPKKYIKILIKFLLVDKDNIHRGTEDDNIFLGELISSH